MDDSIIIIRGSKALNIIKQLEASLSQESLPQKDSSVTYTSFNNKVECHVTSSFTSKIDEYINKKKTFKYLDLWKHLKKTNDSVSHVFLSGYLKSKNFSKATYKAQNGSLVKIWSKIPN